MRRRPTCAATPATAYTLAALVGDAATYAEPELIRGHERVRPGIDPAPARPAR